MKLISIYGGLLQAVFVNGTFLGTCTKKESLTKFRIELAELTQIQN